MNVYTLIKITIRKESFTLQIYGISSELNLFVKTLLNIDTMTGLFLNIMFQDLLAQYPGVRLEVEQYLSKWSRNLTIDYRKTLEKYILLDKVYFLVNL